MKKVHELMKSKPSYTKWGNKRLAELLSLKEVTIERFKRSAEFKNIKRDYIARCSK